MGPANAPAEFEHLQCLNVWGGNGHVDTGLAVTGLDIALRSRPWHDEDQGGDLYLVSTCACAAISRIILADVAGHGDRVAPLTRRLRKLMYKHINEPDQSRLAQALNHEFSELGLHSRFATALLMTYLPETDHLIVCNAGHPPPLWFRQDDQRWHFLRPDASIDRVAGDFPLGVLPGTTYQQCVVQLAPGDLIMLYSDGVLEARNADGRYLGLEGLRSMVMQLDVDPATLARQTLDAIAALPAADAEDDQTVIVLSHNASDPPEQSISQKLSVLARMIGVKLSTLQRT